MVSPFVFILHHFSTLFSFRFPSCLITICFHHFSRFLCEASSFLSFSRCSMPFSSLSSHDISFHQFKRRISIMPFCFIACHHFASFKQRMFIMLLCISCFFFNNDVFVFMCFHHVSSSCIISHHLSPDPHTLPLPLPCLVIFSLITSHLHNVLSCASCYNLFIISKHFHHDSSVFHFVMVFHHL